MKRCAQCRGLTGKPIHGYYSFKDRLLRRAGGCNWLDWLPEDYTCPHCGGLLEYFRPWGPLGDWADKGMRT